MDLRPFTALDWNTWSGCDSAHPRIGETTLLLDTPLPATVIVDGKTLSVHVNVVARRDCGPCRGTGAGPQDNADCPHCGGSGATPTEETRWWLGDYPTHVVAALVALVVPDGDRPATPARLETLGLREMGVR